jgi:ATP-dependent Lon protease
MAKSSSKSSVKAPSKSSAKKASHHKKTSEKSTSTGYPFQPDNDELEEISIPKRLSVLPLRDVVIYPYMIYPILIGRESSLNAVSASMNRDRFVFLAAQKDENIDEPTKDDIYTYGTVAKIIQLVKLPNNLVKILVEGFAQGRCKKFFNAKNNIIEAEIEIASTDIDEESQEFGAMMRHAHEAFIEYIKANRNIPPEAAIAFENLEEPVRKLYYASAHLQLDVEQKQSILNEWSLQEQYFRLVSILTSEIELMKLELDIDSRVQETIQKSQKKYFIQEQIRALQQELGDDDDGLPETTKLRNAIEEAGMPDTVKAKALEEFDKLRKTPSMSPEYGVLRNYVDWLLALPWSKKTHDVLDIDHVRTILDEDHYGLEKIKERVLEYIAVMNLVNSVRGQILCFVGPPGVGKTSLAKSIARALGRSFVRIALGGIRDEAEIRGHRRTYIGSMPGKIIQSMKRAGTVNPVILLDEVDKMSADFRGDPSSAMLEVLDPEQNSTFNDHYLEVDYDLSKVLFIATANVKYDIPLPLLDRMEVIELSSYVEHEKKEIAVRHILPKQLERHGMKHFKINVQDDAITTLIREYTRESGVRNLERQIASIIRKLAKSAVTDIAKEEARLRDESRTKAQAKITAGSTAKKVASQTESAVPGESTGNPSSSTETSPYRPKAEKIVASRKVIVNTKTVHEYLKTPPYRQRANALEDRIGVVTGLAWTSVGGDILPVEITIMQGKDKLTLTGKLGDVMKESAMAALSYVRANAESLGVPLDFGKDQDIHIHVPEGAIPKDGPSAGITMTMALISAASKRPARGDIAMTGEVTLRGNILAIGGLNEKLLAAKRHGIRTVLIPKENEGDLAEISKEILDGLTVIPVEHISVALPYVLRS